MKLCKCGCGMPTPIAKWTNKRCGHIKGEPITFINGHYSKLQPKGDRAHRWNGGMTKTNGYNMILKPGHPRADCRGRIRNFHVVAEKALGKFLPRGCVIHHVDGQKDNDKNSNLIVCENNAYHLFLHQRKRAYEACGHAQWRKCGICKEYDDPANLYIPRNGGSIYHNSCRRKRYHDHKQLIQDM